MFDNRAMLPDAVPVPSGQALMFDNRAMLPDAVPVPSGQAVMFDNRAMLPDAVPVPSGQAVMSVPITDFQCEAHGWCITLYVA